MGRSPRRGGRRLLFAAMLALAGLVATGAATLAQPLLEGPAHEFEPRDEQVDLVPLERRIRAAGVGRVEPVADPLAKLDARVPRTFAAFEDVELVEPATDPLAIGFHQAGGGHPALTPVGRIESNDNPGRTPTVRRATDGAPVQVMASRGRGGPATSAVDVALRPGTVVRSVVTGVVTAVEPYHLYGEHRDVLVEIAPTGRHDVRVMLYHLQDVVVEVGDPVFAGLTPIAGGARDLPVNNQIDRYARTCPCPHVDIRLRLL